MPAVFVAVPPEAGYKKRAPSGARLCRNFTSFSGTVKEVLAQLLEFFCKFVYFRKYRLVSAPVLFDQLSLFPVIRSCLTQ